MSRWLEEKEEASLPIVRHMNRETATELLEWSMMPVQGSINDHLRAGRNAHCYCCS